MRFGYQLLSHRMFPRPILGMANVLTANVMTPATDPLGREWGAPPWASVSGRRNRRRTGGLEDTYTPILCAPSASDPQEVLRPEAQGMCVWCSQNFGNASLDGLTWWPRFRSMPGPDSFFFLGGGGRLSVLPIIVFFPRIGG